MSDLLSKFDELESCPDCGCLTKNSVMRCPECGLFHVDLNDLGDRDPPPVTPVVIQKADLDPSLYSLNPSAPLPVQEEEEQELHDPTKTWGESNSDFAADFDDKPVAEIKQKKPDKREGKDE
jgi:hypothetical protein